MTYGRFKITTRFRTDSGCYATTGLKMKHLLSGQERTIWHLQYTDWPEHGCPEDLKGFLCKCLRSRAGGRPRASLLPLYCCLRGWACFKLKISSIRGKLSRRRFRV